MKKLSLLIILSIFLTSILAGTVYAEEKSLVKSALSKFGDMTEYLLGGIFKGISNNPHVWLRVIAFIAIYAVLFNGLKLTIAKASGKFVLDEKTAGILGFVLSFATASVMPIGWLILALTMWSGIIMIIILAIPMVYLGKLTYDSWKDLNPGKFRLIVLIAGWIAYAAIVSTATLTLSTNAVAGSEWKEILDPTTKNTMVTGFIEIIYIIIFVAAGLLVIKMALSTGERVLTSQAGGKRLGSPVKTIKSYFRGADIVNLAVFYEAAETLLEDLDVAKQDSKENTKEICKKSLTTILTGLANLKEKGIPNIKTAAKELSDAGKLTKSVEQDITSLDANINAAIGNIQTALASIKNDEGTKWEQIKRKIRATTSVINAIQKIIGGITTAQAKK